MMYDNDDFEANLGISRRSLIKRGAVVGGTLVWAAPVVQSISAPAYAAGTPLENGESAGAEPVNQP